MKSLHRLFPRWVWPTLVAVFSIQMWLLSYPAIRPFIDLKGRKIHDYTTAPEGLSLLSKRDQRFMDSMLKWPKREEKCNRCFVNDYHFLYNPIPDVCKRQTAELLILIISSPSNSHQRKRIRESWLKVIQEHFSDQIGAIFLIGRWLASKELRQSLSKEVKAHKDVVLVNFVESYFNLTVKTIMGLKWMSKFCSSAKYVLKIDDDMPLNIPLLLKMVLVHGPSELFQFNIIGKRAKYLEPNRNNQTKWYLPQTYYPEKILPLFCEGPIYLLTNKLATVLLRTSESVPYFPLEDVYMGFCLRVLRNSGIKQFENSTAVTRREFRLIGGDQLKPSNMKTRYLCNCEITGHYYSEANMRRVWDILRKGGCATRKPKDITDDNLFCGLNEFAFNLVLSIDFREKKIAAVQYLVGVLLICSLMTRYIITSRRFKFILRILQLTCLCLIFIILVLNTVVYHYYYS